MASSYSAGEKLHKNNGEERFIELCQSLCVVLLTILLTCQAIDLARLLQCLPKRELAILSSFPFIVSFSFVFTAQQEKQQQPRYWWWIASNVQMVFHLPVHKFHFRVCFTLSLDALTCMGNFHYEAALDQEVVDLPWISLTSSYRDPGHLLKESTLLILYIMMRQVSCLLN